MHRDLVAAATLILALCLAAPAHAEEEAACGLASAPGIDPVDAQTSADLVCAEVHPKPGEIYRVRLARLEHKVVLGLTRTGVGGGERHLVLGSLEEVPTAAPRLAEAMSSEKAVVETQTVDNIVGEEARTPKRRPAEVHAYLGIAAVGFLGSSSQARGGVELGMAFGSSTTSFVLDGRLAGESLMAPLSAIGSAFAPGMAADKNRRPVEGALGTGSAGVRQHFGTGDTSPFVGAGIGLGYLSTTTSAGPRASGSSCGRTSSAASSVCVSTSRSSSSRAKSRARARRP
jgi:opacity protein-like surface antigen